MNIASCFFNYLFKSRGCQGLLNICLKKLAFTLSLINSLPKFAALITVIMLSGGMVWGQTKGTTQHAGANAGNPSTKRATISEIVDFVGYNDSLAGSNSGQKFEILMSSGYILKFTLKRTGSTISAVPLLTNPKAGMGGVAYMSSSKTALLALYTTVKPCDATLVFDDLAVFRPDGTLAPSWNLIIIDSETTNTASETTTITTNGQSWTEWDLITRTVNNPMQSGIGTSTLKWTGTVSTATGAYAAASCKPTMVTSVLKGARQGISMAIESIESDKNVETCSGTPINFTSSEISPASEITYTWSAPIIAGRMGPQSLTGATAQSTALDKVSQTLINNTDSIAKAIYTITPHHQSGSDLTPFNLTFQIQPLPVSTINYSGPFCPSGKAQVSQAGQAGGTYTSTNGLRINSLTGEIDLEASIPGNYTITYTFRNETCTNITQTDLTINALPKATISYGGPYCATGSARVIHTGEPGGIFSSTTGLVINSITGELDLKASVPGNYIVSYNFGSGSCRNSTNASVVINSLPTVTATASSAIICAGNSVTLTGGGATSYKWNNGVIDGIPFKPVATNLYTVTGINVNGCIDTATVLITVNPCPPVANPDEVTGSENLNISGSVALNDSDPKGAGLIYTGLSNPANGTITFKPDGSFIFIPHPHWNGTTYFDYQVCDKMGFCDKSKLTITILPVNDPPVAIDDAYVTTEDTPLLVGVPGIMKNDTDVDHDILSSILLTGPSNGTVVLNQDGSFHYIPDLDFHGTDIFTYNDSDGSLKSNIATVIITVMPVNDPPLAVDEHLSFVTGKPFTGSVALNDSDPDDEHLNFISVADPSHGKVILNPDGSFIYIAEDGYFGKDQFVYNVCDSSGACREATAYLNVLPFAIVNLTPAITRVSEGNKVIITAVLSQPLLTDIEVTLEYGGDAQNGKDYNLNGNTMTIRIPAGQVTTEEFVLIGTLIDNINEKDEHALVSITRVTSNSVQIGTGADVVILDVYPMDKEINETVVNAEIKPDPLLSPNSDKQGNENFRIANIELFPDNEVVIFNRWGNEVFRINNYNNNERSFQGKANTGLLTNLHTDLAEGVYYYVIYSTGAAKKKWLNKGFLILKR